MIHKFLVHTLIIEKWPSPLVIIFEKFYWENNINIYFRQHKNKQYTIIYQQRKLMHNMMRQMLKIQHEFPFLISFSVSRYKAVSVRFLLSVAAFAIG